MKEKTIHVRLSISDYNWLTQNATNVSFFIRDLIQEARRKDEERPLKARINDTQKLLDEATRYLDVVARHPWADTPEVKASFNRQTKTVERLKAKLAMLQAQKS